MKISLETNRHDADIMLTLNRRKIEADADVRYLWNGEADGIWLKVFESDTGAVCKTEKALDIHTPDDEIISQFNDQKAMIAETESSGIEYTDKSGREEPYPYNPDQIRIDPRPYQVNLVNELIEEGDIDLAPDFQRRFVWKDIGQRSRLIESMMLRIPLPIFYLAQDAEGRFQVVDGLQRLTVINQFLKNEFRLKNLEYLRDCEGKYFNKGEKSIESKYAKRITQTQLIFNIIDSQTPFRVRFDIFKRINRGGKPLNSQEIRNCMAFEKTRKLLKELANSNEFKTATDNSVNPTRMEDQELVLRFIGFYYSRYLHTLKYWGNMEDFLDSIIRVLNSIPDAEYGTIRTAFFRAMENAAYLFGVYAFRKCKTEHLQLGARKQLINKSLFTTWSVLLSQHIPEDVKKNMEPGHLNRPLALAIDNYPAYYDALTTGTNDMNKIETSFHFAQKILYPDGSS